MRRHPVTFGLDWQLGAKRPPPSSAVRKREFKRRAVCLRHEQPTKLCMMIMPKALFLLLLTGALAGCATPSTFTPQQRTITDVRARTGSPTKTKPGTMPGLCSYGLRIQPVVRHGMLDRRLHPVTVHLLWCHYVAPHHETAHALVVSFRVHWRADEFRVDVFIALQACSTSMVRTPVPEDLQDDVAVLGCDDFRIWAHEPLRDIERLLLENRKQQVAGGMMYDENGEVRDANALAISGGGDNGAFSAGVLSGWSEL
jgi:hypothetical protein